VPKVAGSRAGATRLVKLVEQAFGVCEKRSIAGTWQSPLPTTCDECRVEWQRRASDAWVFMLVPEEQRRFAVEVVHRLRSAGFTAYLAGGCVRDQLLGRTPKDYDVATDATPSEIRRLFGRRRTLAIGAAFGVISVRGPQATGTVEVATFRRDVGYSDGRHPDEVTFSSAAEDASRRDFTINGLFFDPLTQQVIDFVGGQKDLAEQRVRAIGDPRQRFGEDKLRMLRAVRFAATLGFQLDAQARRAIADMAGEIVVVSPERIAMEMRHMLIGANAAAAVRLMLETGLADIVLPEIVPHTHEQRERFDRVLEILTRAMDAPLRAGSAAPDTGVAAGEIASSPSFPLALAALLHASVDPHQAAVICRRWRLSNAETERTVWLVAHHGDLQHVRAMRWSALQPILICEGAADLLRLIEAASPDGAEVAAYCRGVLAQPRDALDPPPFVTGDDLLALGFPPGPRYKVLLQRLRDAQLDQEIHNRDEALAQVAKWLLAEH
jgi:poly(A) polymerase